MDRTQAIFTQYEMRVRFEAHLKLKEHGYSGIDPRPDAPNTLTGLLYAYGDFKQGDLFPVFDGGSEFTVFSNPESNFLFRAWHDLIHIELLAPFTLEGEMAVAREQIRQAGLHGELADVLWADVVGQTQYFKTHGEFPVDQRSFVIQSLKEAA